MTSMLQSKGRSFISRLYVILAIFFVFIGFVIECTQTAAIHQHLDASERSMFVDTFKKRILDHLGLKEPPKLRPRNETLANAAIREQINDFLRRMKENEKQYGNPLKNEDMSENRARELHRGDEEKLVHLHFHNSGRSLRFPVPRVSDSLLESSDVLTFTANSKALERNEKIKFKSAILRINVALRRKRLNPRGSPYQNPFNITVSLIRNALPKASNQTRVSQSIKSFIAHPSKSQQFQINLSSYLSSISDAMQYNNGVVAFGISVREMPQLGTSRRANKIENKRGQLNSENKLAMNALSPFLQIVSSLDSTIVQAGRQGLRKKRHASKNTDRDLCGKPHVCRRHSIHISFADIGWDNWVFSPDEYTAYFCSGKCPSGCKTNAFGAIKSILHKQNPSRIPPLICSPTGYQSLNLLQLRDSGELEEINFPGMKVTGCGCQ